MTEWIPHAPTPRQHAALLISWSRELLYGGAAGGGKSDYLLMAALQYVDVPGYAALILRRTFPQLSQSDGLLPRAQEWLSNTSAVGAESVGGYPSRYDFPSGARLSFAHVQHVKDRFNFQGGAWSYIGFDELTQFPEAVYLYLHSRNRRPKDPRRALSRVPLRMRAASNPGGEGHDWVRARFVMPKAGGSEETQRPLFLPARLSDNPYLDALEYERSLDQLHPYERAQLLAGDWDARPPGSRFRREWFAVVDEHARGSSLRSWDLAATEPKAGRDPDWTCGVLWTKDEHGYQIDDVVRFRASPGELDRRIRSVAEQDGQIPVWIEQEPGSSGKIAGRHLQRVLDGYECHLQPSTGDKVVRANPMASAAERGDIRVRRGPWLADFLTELEHFPGGSHDDQVTPAWRSPEA
jgi:predicted phage terminase large subunit-like protein